jgi:hypothetical protein
LILSISACVIWGITRNSVVAAVPNLIAGVLLLTDAGDRLPRGARLYGLPTGVLFAIEEFVDADQLWLNLAYLIPRVVAVGSLIWACRRARAPWLTLADTMSLLALVTIVGWLLFGELGGGSAQATTFASLELAGAVALWFLFSLHTRLYGKLPLMAAQAMPIIAVGFIFEGLELAGQSAFAAWAEFFFVVGSTVLVAGLSAADDGVPVGISDASVVRSAIGVGSAFLAGGLAAGLGIYNGGSDAFVIAALAVLAFAGLGRVVIAASIELRMFNSTLEVAQTDAETGVLSRFALRDALRSVPIGSAAMKVRLSNLRELRSEHGVEVGDGVMAAMGRFLAELDHLLLGRTADNDLVVVRRPGESNPLLLFSAHPVSAVLRRLDVTVLVGRTEVHEGDTASSIEHRLDEDLVPV